MIAAFQGVPGAYSQLACRQLLGERVRTSPCETFDDVFAAVEKGKAALGVIPIENSLAGSIHQNYDLLLSHDLVIIGETRLKVEHVLMCHPTTSLARLREVRSHPQALAQCSAFFAREKARLRPVSYFDTAGAAKSLSEEAPAAVGAIASAYAAELYGLKVLKHNLQNHADNFTRFLAIAPRNSARSLSRRIVAGGGQGQGLKTSVAFMPAANRVGVLFRTLGVFALRDIDLLKIESRPNPLSPFEYWFYLDFAGGQGEPRVDKALDHLRETAGTLKVLGSYPSAAPAPSGARKTHTRR
ncbi:MAG TPA: prephenate dehydratase [Fibrobacteria bacterium]|nr:prephenate dehydratase [Fibrobacteria bacterium]